MSDTADYVRSGPQRAWGAGTQVKVYMTDNASAIIGDVKFSDQTGVALENATSSGGETTVGETFIPYTSIRRIDKAGDAPTPRAATFFTPSGQ